MVQSHGKPLDCSNHLCEVSSKVALNYGLDINLQTDTQIDGQTDRYGNAYIPIP